MNPMAILPDTNHFLTVVVNSTHAVFYKNVDLVGVAPIPRPLTDCLNPEGVLLGDNNMELGQLRFYPRALGAASIKEIYKYGSTLADISTGANAYDVVAAGLPALRKSLEGTISEVKSGVASRQNDVEIAQIAQLSVQQPANQNDDAPDYAGADEVEYVENKATADNRTYHRIFEGPNRINRERVKYTSIPDTTGIGFTMSFWYKHVACEVKLCEVCPLSAPETVRMCVQEGGVFLSGASCSKSGGKNGVFSFDNLGMPSKYFFGASKDKFWRHIAVQIDETSNKIRFFLDGAQAIESDLNLCNGISLVAQLDGSDRLLAFSGYTDTTPVCVRVCMVVRACMRACVRRTLPARAYSPACLLSLVCPREPTHMHEHTKTR